MKAIILAAGRGSRLGGLSDNNPKCFNDVGGKKLIEWQIEALKSSGVKDIVIVTGYKSKAIEKLGYNTIHNSDWENTNMVKSLECASELLENDLIVSYADILYGPLTIKSLIKNNKDIVISYDKNWKTLWKKRFKNILDDAESFKIDKSKRVTEIGKKVKDVSEIEGQYMGLMRFNQKGLAILKEFLLTHKDSIVKMDMTKLLSILIKDNKPVHGMSINEHWCEIDAPNDLIVANELFNQGKLCFDY